eukprot:GHVH01000419.1.p1 GENE.GHVH01000419.1~~GHVH01000419.1.p1  ORF type:complete len:2299 (+),score=321.39 GHVH01000419.1:150-7046(+)
MMLHILTTVALISNPQAELHSIDYSMIEKKLPVSAQSLTNLVSTSSELPWTDGDALNSDNALLLFKPTSAHLSIAVTYGWITVNLTHDPIDCMIKNYIVAISPQATSNTSPVVTYVKAIKSLLGDVTGFHSFRIKMPLEWTNTLFDVRVFPELSNCKDQLCSSDDLDGIDPWAQGELCKFREDDFNVTYKPELWFDSTARGSSTMRRMYTYEPNSATCSFDYMQVEWTPDGGSTRSAVVDKQDVLDYYFDSVDTEYNELNSWGYVSHDSVFSAVKVKVRACWSNKTCTAWLKTDVPESYQIDAPDEVDILVNEDGRIQVSAVPGPLNADRIRRFNADVVDMQTKESVCSRSVAFTDCGGKSGKSCKGGKSGGDPHEADLVLDCSLPSSGYYVSAGFTTGNEPGPRYVESFAAPCTPSLSATFSLTQETGLLSSVRSYKIEYDLGMALACGFDTIIVTCKTSQTHNLCSSRESPSGNEIIDPVIFDFDETGLITSYFLSTVHDGILLVPTTLIVSAIDASGNIVDSVTVQDDNIVGSNSQAPILTYQPKWLTDQYIHWQKMLFLLPVDYLEYEAAPEWTSVTLSDAKGVPLEVVSIQPEDFFYPVFNSKLGATLDLDADSSQDEFRVASNASISYGQSSDDVVGYLSPINGSPIYMCPVVHDIELVSVSDKSWRIAWTQLSDPMASLCAQKEYQVQCAEFDGTLLLPVVLEHPHSIPFVQLGSHMVTMVWEDSPGYQMFSVPKDKFQLEFDLDAPSIQCRVVVLNDTDIESPSFYSLDKEFAKTATSKFSIAAPVITTYSYRYVEFSIPDGIETVDPSSDRKDLQTTLSFGGGYNGFTFVTKDAAYNGHCDCYQYHLSFGDGDLSFVKAVIYNDARTDTITPESIVFHDDNFYRCQRVMNLVYDWVAHLTDEFGPSYIKLSWDASDCADFELYRIWAGVCKTKGGTVHNRCDSDKFVYSHVTDIDDIAVTEFLFSNNASMDSNIHYTKFKVEVFDEDNHPSDVFQPIWNNETIPDNDFTAADVHCAVDEPGYDIDTGAAMNYVCHLTSTTAFDVADRVPVFGLSVTDGTNITKVEALPLFATGDKTVTYTLDDSDVTGIDYQAYVKNTSVEHIDELRSNPTQVLSAKARCSVPAPPDSIQYDVYSDELIIMTSSPGMDEQNARCNAKAYEAQCIPLAALDWGSLRSGRFDATTVHGTLRIDLSDTDDYVFKCRILIVDDGGLYSGASEVVEMAQVPANPSSVEITLEQTDKWGSDFSFHIALVGPDGSNKWNNESVNMMKGIIFDITWTAVDGTIFSMESETAWDAKLRAAAVIDNKCVIDLADFPEEVAIADLLEMKMEVTGWVSYLDSGGDVAKVVAKEGAELKPKCPVPNVECQWIPDPDINALDDYSQYNGAYRMVSIRSLPVENSDFCNMKSVTLDIIGYVNNGDMPADGCPSPPGTDLCQDWDDAVSRELSPPDVGKSTNVMIDGEASETLAYLKLRVLTANASDDLSVYSPDNDCILLREKLQAPIDLLCGWDESSSLFYAEFYRGTEPYYDEDGWTDNGTVQYRKKGTNQNFIKVSTTFGELNTTTGLSGYSASWSANEYVDAGEELECFASGISAHPAAITTNSDLLVGDILIYEPPEFDNCVAPLLSMLWLASDALDSSPGTSTAYSLSINWSDTVIVDDPISGTSSELPLADYLSRCSLRYLTIETLNSETDEFENYKNIECLTDLSNCQSPDDWFSDGLDDELILDAEYAANVDITRIVRVCAVNAFTPPPDETSCIVLDYPTANCKPPTEVTCNVDYFNQDPNHRIFTITQSVSNAALGCGNTDLYPSGPESDSKAFTFRYTLKGSEGDADWVYVPITRKDLSPTDIDGNKINGEIYWIASVDVGEDYYTNDIKCEAAAFLSNNDPSPTGLAALGLWQSAIGEAATRCMPPTSVTCDFIDDASDQNVTSTRGVQFRPSENCYGNQSIEYWIEVYNLSEPEHPWSSGTVGVGEPPATTDEYWNTFWSPEETPTGPDTLLRVEVAPLEFDLDGVWCRVYATVKDPLNQSDTLWTDGSARGRSEDKLCEAPSVVCIYTWLTNYHESHWNMTVGLPEGCDGDGFAVNYGSSGGAYIDREGYGHEVAYVKLPVELNNSDVLCSAAILTGAAHEHVGLYSDPSDSHFYTTTSSTTHSAAQDIVIVNRNFRTLLQAATSFFVILSSLADVFDITDACFSCLGLQFVRGSKNEITEEQILLLKEAARKNAVMRSVQELQLEGLNRSIPIENDNRIIVCQNTMELNDLRGGQECLEVLNIERTMDQSKPAPKPAK